MKLFYFSTLNGTGLCNEEIILELQSMPIKSKIMSKIKEEASEFEIQMIIKDQEFRWAPELEIQLNHIQAFMN